MVYVAEYKGHARRRTAVKRPPAWDREAEAVVPCGLSQPTRDARPRPAFSTGRQRSSVAQVLWWPVL